MASCVGALLVSLVLTFVCARVRRPLQVGRAFSNECPELSNQVIEYQRFVISGCPANRFNVLNSIFSDIASAGTGGALLIKNQSYVIEVSNCMFTNCSTTMNAGAIYAFGTNVTYNRNCAIHCSAKAGQSSELITHPLGVIVMNYSLVCYCADELRHQRVSSFSTAGGFQSIHYVNSTNNMIQNQGSGGMISGPVNISMAHCTFSNNFGLITLYLSIFHHGNESLSTYNRTVSLSNFVNNTHNGKGQVRFNDFWIIEKFIFAGNRHNLYFFPGGDGCLYLDSCVFDCGPGILYQHVVDIDCVFNTSTATYTHNLLDEAQCVITSAPTQTNLILPVSIGAASFIILIIATAIIICRSKQMPDDLNTTSLLVTRDS